MRALLTLTFVLAGSASLAAWAVPARVEVSAEDVRLSDLVANPPPEWAKVSLGRAPRPGGKLVWSRQRILERAQEARPPADLVLPETVEVARSGQSVDREQLTRAVETALAPRVRPDEELRVAAVGLPGMVPEGEVTFDLGPLPTGDLPQTFTVWLDVLAGGEKAGRAWARVEVGRFRPALVLSRNLRRGEILSASDVEVRRVRAGRSSGLSDVNQAAGRRLVRGLSAGAPLGPADLEAVPAVEKGALVKLIARAGSITATTSGRALEAGSLDATLRVENLASRRVVQGVVRERGVVEVLSEESGR